MIKRSSVLLVLIGLCSLPLAPQIVIANARLDAEAALATAAQDKKKVEAVIVAESVAGIAKRNNAGLAYIAMNLGGATDPQSLQRVFDNAGRKGDVEQMMTDHDAFDLARLAAARIPGRVGTFGTTLMTAVEQDAAARASAAPGIQVPISPETQIAVLLGALDKLPDGIRDETYKKLATYLSLDYDALEHAATQSAALTPDYSRQFGELNRKMDAERQAISNLATKDDLKGYHDRTSPAAERDKRLRDLDEDTAHAEAGLFLTGEVLKGVLPPGDVQKFNTAGKSLIQMNKAFQMFGPGGITPDKLLMMTNFVTAGLVVAQMFAAQQDPTQTALSSIMSQLADIEKQLDIIEGKIDNLSDIVMQGFQQSIADTHTLQISVDRFRSLYEATVADQARREAIKGYLLSQDQLVPGLAARSQQCASTLTDTKFDPNQCAKEFAMDLSTKLFTSAPIINVPLISLSLSNRVFSTGWSDNGERIIHQELSAPIFFAPFPKTMWNLVARNHEALASLSQYYFGTSHPRIVTNPDALSQELSVFVEAVQGHDDLRTLSMSFLIGEAIERIDEINTFLANTAGNKEYLETLWSALASRLSIFEEKVNMAVKEATNLSTRAEREGFAGPVMISCDPNLTSFKLPSPPPHVTAGGFFSSPHPNVSRGIDTFIPDPFWVAQSLKMGGLGYCFISSAPPDHYLNSGNVKYTSIRFQLRFYFLQPPGAGQFQPPPRQDGHLRFQEGALIVDSRFIDSPRHFFNQDMTGFDMTAYSWNYGTMPVWWQIYECLGAWDKEGCRTDPNRVVPSLAFIRSSVTELTDSEHNSAVAQVNQEIATALSAAIRYQSQLWDSSRLGAEPSATHNLLNDRAFMQNDDLPRALTSYTSLYLFAKSLLLTAAYHGAPASDCLVALDRFSPKSILDQLAGFKEPTNLDNSGQLTPAMSAVTAGCLSKGVSDELRQLRARLVDLQNSP